MSFFLRPHCQAPVHRQHARRRALLWMAVAMALASQSGVAAAVDPAAGAAANGADASANPTNAIVNPATADGADANANSGTVDFDRSMLSGAGQNTTDLSRFERGNFILPGNYNADVYLNNAWVGRSNIRFASPSAKQSATACVDDKLLDLLGLHPSKLPAEVAAQLKDPAACVSIGSLIQGASMTFNMGELRLDTSVPQAYLNQMPRGYVSPEYWDAGAPAALLNYSFIGYHSDNQGLSQTTSYLTLNAGLNVGLWQFRQDSTATWQSATAGSPAHMQWQSIDAYVRRALPSLRALLTIGDSYTDGQVFDSYGIRGVQLATDDRMLPQSLQGYAPVIHGIAQTNALVTVRQNGVQIYQTTVAPGPFTISDLYPTGYGGNLNVEVTEADGRVSTFSVPYASVAQLLRPGVTRFDVAAGQLLNLNLLHKPNVLQATVQHGFTNLFTGYAGLVGSQGYAAALVGGAINTRYGALGMDITQADARVPGYASQDGQSLRITYSKIIPETGTSLTVAAYRYSTNGYLSLTDAAVARDYVARGIDPFQYVAPTPAPTPDGIPGQSAITPTQLGTLDGSIFTNDAVISGVGLQRQRSSFTLTLNQRLGQSGGSIYASGSMSNYWNRSGTDSQFQLGYSNSWHRVSYNVTAMRTRDALGRYDNEYMVNFTLPLGSGSHAPSLTMNLAHDQENGAQDQAMINGTLGSDNQFNYGASATHSTQGGNAGSLNAGYRSPFAVLGASYADGNGYSQASVSANGSVIVHPGGITFGQPVGDTVGIVYAPGAEGARLNGAAGGRIDSSGYGVVPYLMPYMINSVQIDPKGLPLDVQLDETSAQVAPYAGAVVMLKFKTESGRSIIMRARRTDGQALPFGAEVFNEKGNPLGVVGQAGQILLRGVNQSGTLTAKWQDDDGSEQSCTMDYTLPDHAKSGKKSAQGAYEQIMAVCSKPKA